MIQSGLFILREFGLPRLSFCDMQKPTFLDTDLEQEMNWGFIFIDPPTITSNGCSTSSIIGSSLYGPTDNDKLFRFFLSYGQFANDQDCYSEITFSRKTKLKLTVSNFKVLITFQYNLWLPILIW